MTTQTTDDIVFAYQEKFPHSLTMDVLYTALDEEEEETARKMLAAIVADTPLTDSDFQEKVAPEVAL